MIEYLKVNQTRKKPPMRRVAISHTRRTGGVEEIKNYLFLLDFLKHIF